MLAHAPLRGDVEVVEGEPDGVDEPGGTSCTRGVRPVLLHALAGRQPPAVAGLVGLFEAGMSGGGGGGGVPSSTSMTHLPRSTGDVRFASDVSTRMLPCPSTPRRVSSGWVTRRKVAARHARDAVVPGQPLVDERVVGPVEVEQAAVFLHEVREEQLGLAPHRPREVLVVVRVEVRVGPNLVHVLQAKPLRREARAQRLGPGVGEHAQGLPLQLFGGQAVRLGQGPELFVGRRAPQEERQARGEGGVAQAVAPPRRVDRRPLEPQHEVGAREHRLERGPHADLEAAGRRAFVEERQQSVDVAGGEGPAVRFAAPGA